MPDASRNVFHVLPRYQPLMREVGIDAEAVFDHPDIVAWRKLPDRENCTLDARFDGKPVRLHVKRYQAASGGGGKTPAQVEVDALKLLQDAQIPTLTIVGSGRLEDGRSFTITEDLTGYRDAEKAIRDGAVSFESLLEPTADLAAKLHEAELHHRDLYLCHFFVRPEDPADVRLIDVARVARLANPLTKMRWIVKDLAQFAYSTTSLPVTDEQRDRWLTRYADRRNLCWLPRLERAVARKVRWIAGHDAKLRAKQPTRNVSIPDKGAGA